MQKSSMKAVAARNNGIPGPRNSPVEKQGLLDVALFEQDFHSRQSRYQARRIEQMSKVRRDPEPNSSRLNPTFTMHRN